MALVNPTKDSEVTAAIESDTVKLSKFIENLKLYPPQMRPGDIKEILPDVIGKFEVVAREYLERGQELLDGKEARTRLVEYSRLQSRVEDHTLKLYELARPDPDKPYFPRARRQLLSQLIAFVGRRISGHSFIWPVLGDSFKYVHFNYVDGFGLICLPPRMAREDTNNHRNLGIFWHEAAGVAIATARRKHSEELTNWTKILNERMEDKECLELYTKLYGQSLPETKIRAGSWQVTWLSEFLEDLFWIMVGNEGDMPGELAEGVVNALADALASAYKNLTVGDPGHPPPHLRILVAISFLCRGEEDYYCINERINKLVEYENKEDIFEITKDVKDVPLRELAAVIGSVCRDILDEQGENPWLYDTKVSPEEKAIAGSILKSSGSLPSKYPVMDQEENPNAYLKYLLDQIKSMDLESSDILLSKNPVLDQEEIAPDANQEDFLDQIKRMDLKSLLAIEFTTDDPHGTDTLITDQFLESTPGGPH